MRQEWLPSIMRQEWLQVLISTVNVSMREECVGSLSAKFMIMYKITSGRKDYPKQQTSKLVWRLAKGGLYNQFRYFFLREALDADLSILVIPP